MGCGTIKSGENMYFGCRKKAAKYNDKLGSREGASESLGVSVSTLADYELGITKVVPVDNVMRMADLYNAPELKQWYCATECPLGKDRQSPLDISDDRSFIRAKNALDDIETSMNTFAGIMDDGIISPDEVEQVVKSKQRLVDAKQRIEQFLLAIEKAEIRGSFNA